MKKIVLILSFFLISSMAFAQTGLILETGKQIEHYYPKGACLNVPAMDNIPSLYVTKICKSSNYHYNDSYELQLTFINWEEKSVIPITFTYFIDKGATIELENCSALNYLENGGPVTESFRVSFILENYLYLESKD